MTDYRTYGPHDFLTDDWFLAWAKHDQSDARAFWEAFSRENPDKRDELLLAKDMAEALHRRQPALPNEHISREVAEIMRLTANIEALPEAQLQPRLVPEHTVFGRIWPRWAAAAAVVSMLVVGWGYWQTYRPATEPASVVATTNVPAKPGTAGWVEQENGTSEPVAITLPDGSELVLNPKSRATYRAKFDQKTREVWLTGDAQFAVVRDVRRPFLVRSGPLVTRVLGTKFSVHAPANATRITVSVQHGKVSVYDQRDGANGPNGPYRPNQQVSGVVLTANQQVVYDAERTSFQRELVAKPALLDPAANVPEQFVFEDTPIHTVFERLQKNYGITIQYDATLFRHCTVTASLANVPLHDQLKLICASIGATYQIVDTQIIVSGTGCQ